jgi:hypothetical protein
MFENFGTILDMKLENDHAFVTFRDQKNADDAKAELNGMSSVLCFIFFVRKEIVWRENFG